MGAPARTVLGHGRQIRETTQDVGTADVGDPEGAHTGGVDDPAAAGQGEGLEAGGGVAAAAGDLVDVPGGAVGAGHDRVDERGLADPGVTDEHRDGAGERPADRLDAVVGLLLCPLGLGGVGIVL